MFVEYWSVGATSSTAHPMMISDISAHLLQDLMPMLPPSVGASFMGWPPFLIEQFLFRRKDHLAIRVDAGRTERQWKRVLSWRAIRAARRPPWQRRSHR